jgi:hypothetical protein
MRSNFLILFLFQINRVFSQDIIGGHMRTELLSAFSCSITVTLFTDASQNINRPSIVVDFGDSSTGTFTLNNTSNSNGIKLETYSGLHTYAGAGAYLASYTGNFRVAGLKNMFNSPAQQFCTGSQIKIGTFAGINSPPVKSLYPLQMTSGVNQTFLYNGGFSDSDGDSLSFQLISCCGVGYYLPANAGVSNLNGIFSFSKDTAGKYTFALMIKEWRKGTNNVYTEIATSQLDFIVDILNTVDLKKFTADDAILCLYPNPVLTEINISTKNTLDQNYDVEIVNGLAQVVLKTKYADKINVSDLPKGLYIFRLFRQNIFTECARFVKN